MTLNRPQESANSLSATSQSRCACTPLVMCPASLSPPIADAHAPGKPRGQKESPNAVPLDLSSLSAQELCCTNVPRKNSDPQHLVDILLRPVSRQHSVASSNWLAKTPKDVGFTWGSQGGFKCRWNFPFGVLPVPVSATITFSEVLYMTRVMAHTCFNNPSTHVRRTRDASPSCWFGMVWCDLVSLKLQKARACLALPSLQWQDLAFGWPQHFGHLHPGILIDYESVDM